MTTCNFFKLGIINFWLSVLIFLMLISFNAFCQIIPENNSTIWYTYAHFQDELIDDAVFYVVEIVDDINSFDDTLKSIKSKNHIPSFFVGNLSWDKKYYWRVKSFNKNNDLIKVSENHNFNIQSISTIDFTEVKLKVNSSEVDQYSRGYISLDNTRSIFDRSGNKVWSMPMIKDVVNEKSQVRDIKLTKDNTITFLTDKNVYEIDFNGNVLWNGPQPSLLGKDTIRFHHAFLKDDNGNYWALGQYETYKKVLSKINEKILPYVADVIVSDTGVYKKIEMDVLIKFDKNGKALWFWDSNTYLTIEDINYKKNSDSVPEFSIHSNAFSINKQQTYAYLGMRDMSRIVKIDIKTNKVVNSYGAKYPSGEAKSAINGFKYQHDANVTNHKSIFILNNNTREREPSAIMELRDDEKSKDNSVLWKFNLDFDSLTNGRSVKGGNVNELNNGNLLVCAGTLNRVFEVTKQKKTVWDGFVYCKSSIDTSWHNMPQYRCNTFNKIVFKGLLVKIENLHEVNKKISATCLVINSGNVADSYTIEIKDASGKVYYSMQSPIIEPGKYHEFVINVQSDSSDLLLKTNSVSNKYVLSRKKFFVKKIEE